MKKNTILTLIAFTSALLGCEPNSGNPTVSIYIDDGAIQCEFSGNTPEETAQVLIDNRIDVIRSTCGYIDGLAVEAQCGLGDLNINIHVIPTENLSDAENLGYTPVSELSEGYVETCS